MPAVGVVSPEYSLVAFNQGIGSLIGCFVKKCFNERAIYQDSSNPNPGNAKAGNGGGNH
jgi:hypothetical protein